MFCPGIALLGNGTRFYDKTVDCKVLVYHSNFLSKSLLYFCRREIPVDMALHFGNEISCMNSISSLV